ncbi:MAG: nicotinate-nucleotide adenylyltransferase [Actinomycetota bacterium]|nr:nicotinate-nucleotide adenylyltransferase [Actinomycetota bacterium]
MRRGILGGTFDPPHLAHLVAAETAFRQLGLDIVTLIPVGDPWQKAGRAVSDPRHRIAMTKLSIQGVDYLEVDDREVRRRGATYTIDTVESFGSADEIVLIVGADAAAGVDTWHRPDDLRARATFAVMPRHGVTAAEVAAAVGQAPVAWLRTPELAISSTELRYRVARRDSIRFLVADAVWRYVEDQGLYTGSSATPDAATP